MEAVTISQVSRSFGISTRMLRHYEKAGLIDSFRRDDYAYRMYNEAALSRLRQILILRKLRVPLKQIKVILQKPDAVTVIEVFQQNVAELDNEIAALSTIRSIIGRFIEELRKAANVQISSLITQDKTVLTALEALSQLSINFKEDKTLDKLKRAEEHVPKINDVRIVYLPPAYVASAHYIGDDPEYHVSVMIDKFVRDTGLIKIKPDLRHYGFNHPNPKDVTGYHGYEMWVTVPDGMEVPPPLVKKHFAGGLYAAHMIPMGNFNEWEWLMEWVNKSDRYEFAGDMQDQEHMCGLLEEHLNYVSHLALNNTEPEDLQLDLLLPLKEQS